MSAESWGYCYFGGIAMYILIANVLASRWYSLTGEHSDWRWLAAGFLWPVASLCAFYVLARNGPERKLRRRIAEAKRERRMLELRAEAEAEEARTREAFERLVGGEPGVNPNIETRTLRPPPPPAGKRPSNPAYEVGRWRP